MSEAQLIGLGREALLLMLLVSAPALIASLVAGILSSALQVATQIQDSTLSVVPRLAATALALAVTSPWIGTTLSRFTVHLFEIMSGVGR